MLRLSERFPFVAACIGLLSAITVFLGIVCTAAAALWLVGALIGLALDLVGNGYQWMRGIR